MSRLISELKREHDNLFDKISNAKTLGVNSLAGRNMLLSIKADLLDHLRKEDDELYPSLRELAKNDDSVKKLLNGFADDMEKLTKSAVKFFDELEAGEAVDYQGRINKLLGALTDRIRKEEHTIYRLYDDKIKV